MNSKEGNTKQGYLYVKNKVQGLRAGKGTKRIYIWSLEKVFLICILLSMQNVSGLLKIEEVAGVQEAEVCTVQGVTYVARTDGPLSPIMLYLGGKVWEIYDNRLYSSKIHIHFTVSDKKSNNNFTRDPAKDRVFKGYAEGKEVPKNIIDHYNALITMFPSPEGEISIWPKADCKDSFTLFLKSDTGKAHAHTILAALLLKAEGINVPLLLEEVESACPKLVWKSIAQSNKSFSIDIAVVAYQGMDSSSSKKKKYSEYFKEKIVQTIQYFISTASSPKDKATPVGAGLKKKEDPWEHKFINTSAWLIQSYIYYYLETVEDANSFNSEVSSMLCEYIISCRVEHKLEQEKIAKEFLRKCFMPKGTQSETLKCWEKVKNLENIIITQEKMRLLPFTNPAHFPTKTTCKIHIQGEKYLKTKVFSTNVESVLLGLFCCFAYDPKTNEYNFDHVPGIMKEVKDIFSTQARNRGSSSCKSRKMQRKAANRKKLCKNTAAIRVGQDVPKGICQKWREIIWRLVKDDESISCVTLEDGNKIIRSDICNILILILKVVGICSAEEREIVEGFRKDLESAHANNCREIDAYLMERMEEYISALFAFLSRNCTPCQNLESWYQITSVDEENRQVFIEVVPQEVLEEDAGYYFPSNIDIYYAYENTAHCMVLQLVDSKTARLELGKPVVKLDEYEELEELDMLKEKASRIEKNTFPQSTISKYVKNVCIYNPKNIIIDLYILYMGEDADIMLNYKDIQPHQFNTRITNNLLFRMKYETYRDLKSNQNICSSLHNLNNFIANELILNERSLAILIIYIGIRIDKIKDQLTERLGSIITAKYHNPQINITSDLMVMIIENLLEIEAGLDIANIIAAYAQISGYYTRNCLTTLFERLASKGIDTDKIVQYMDVYSTIEEGKLQTEKSLEKLSSSLNSMKI
ncbi:hypothetical protein NEAUS05_1224 [Nematocida ausubeli]|nr:hypothetical protein NEAUS05_1224 [Nematocida ausubeli]